MKHGLKNFGQILLIFSLLGAMLWADDLTITAKVNSTNITLNDILSYTVEINGSSKVTDIPTPEGSNFSIVNGPFSSSNIQIVNGKMESSKSFTWQLAPKKEGELAINGFSVLVSRKKYSVDRVVVNVSQARYKSGNQSNSKESVEQGQQVFLDAVPSKQSVYLGEQVIIEYKVIYNMRITNYDIEKNPAAKGFWIEEFPQIRNPQSNKIVIDGKEYMAAVIKRIALFPTQTGTLEIDPLIMQAEVVLPQQKKSSNSRFDSFFDDSFFNNSIFDRTSVKRVVSQPLKIEVKALPEYTKSDTIPCAMANVTIKGDVDTVEILQDKALTLKYQLNGFGNINAVNVDQPKLPNYVEVFPPKVNKKTNNNGQKIRGEANYEYVLIPHKAGQLSIPPIEFEYFDTDKGRYITKKTDGFEINVLENKNAITASSGLNKEEIKLLDEDIRYILKGNVKWRKAGQQFYQNGNFLMINVVSLLLLVMALGMKFYKTSIGNNPVLMRKTKALKKAQDKIAEATQLRQADKIAEALSKYDGAIGGFISDRLNLPEAGFGPMDFKKELEKNGVANDLLISIFKFLEKMELYKYSPGALSTSDYKKFEDESKQLLSQLSKVI